MTDRELSPTDLDNTIASMETALAELYRLRARERIVEPVEPARFQIQQNEDFIDAGVAASRLGVSKQRLRRWCREHPKISRKLGGRWQVSISRLRSSGLMNVSNVLNVSDPSR